MILLSLSLLSVFGSNVAKFSGAGALGVLTMSTIAAYGWSPSGKVIVLFFSLISFHLIVKMGFGGSGSGSVSVSTIFRQIKAGGDYYFFAQKGGDYFKHYSLEVVPLIFSFFCH